MTTTPFFLFSEDAAYFSEIYWWARFLGSRGVSEDSNDAHSAKLPIARKFAAKRFYGQN